MEEKTIHQYLNELGSKEGKPGGGSAAALVGAMAASLAQMVADIEKNKKKHRDNKDLFLDVLEEAKQLKETFETLSEKDAEAFEPVAQAYKLPKETEEEKEARNEKIEEGLHLAAEPPIQMMEMILSVLHLHRKLVERRISGSIVNDIAVGTLFCRTTLEAAWLNVLVNAKGMNESPKKEDLLKKGERLLEEGKREAERVYQAATNYLETGEWPSSLERGGVK